MGSGLAPGVGLRGRLRDTVMRALTARSVRAGDRQRAAARVEIGLPARDPGPLRRLIATLPALEVPRPDWPAEAVVVGPLHFEPTEAVLTPPPGPGPLVVVAPSTATTGTIGLAELALSALVPGRGLPAGLRVVVSRLAGDASAVPPGRSSGSDARTNCWPTPMWWSAGAATAWWPRRCCTACRWWWCPVAATSGRSPIVLCAKVVAG